jgi:cytochrome c551
MKKLVAALAAIALVVCIAAPAFAQDAKALYGSKCAMCHGPDAKGQTAMGKNLKLRDLTSADVQKQTDAELTTLITNGKGKMPAYKGKLTDAEITSVVKYLRTLK